MIGTTLEQKRTININKTQVKNLVDEILLEYKQFPVNFLNENNPEGEFEYLTILKDYYIRTIFDIVEYTSKLPSKSIKVLEIGAFLGIVSIALSKLGYEVVSTDIPEFISNENLQEKLQKNNIKFFDANLVHYSLPCLNEEFDIVIMCEVLEHLNFNPLPLIKEINRIIKVNGLFYVSLPNIASLKNRMLLLRGKSIHYPINYFVTQLNPRNPMIVGIHWREYTMYEINEMLEMLGFRIEKQYFFDWMDDFSFFNRKGFISRLKFIFKKILYHFLPDLKENQTNIAVKVTNCQQMLLFNQAEVLDGASVSQ